MLKQCLRGIWLSVIIYGMHGAEPASPLHIPIGQIMRPGEAQRINRKIAYAIKFCEKNNRGQNIITFINRFQKHVKTPTTFYDYADGHAKFLLLLDWRNVIHRVALPHFIARASADTMTSYSYSCDDTAKAIEAELHIPKACQQITWYTAPHHCGEIVYEVPKTKTTFTVPASHRVWYAKLLRPTLCGYPVIIAINNNNLPLTCCIDKRTRPLARYTDNDSRLQCHACKKDLAPTLTIGRFYTRQPPPQEKKGSRKGRKTSKYCYRNEKDCYQQLTVTIYKKPALQPQQPPLPQPQQHIPPAVPWWWKCIIL